MDIAKQILVSVLGWVATGILAWLVSKSPKIREWFASNKYAKTVTIALLVSGLLSTIVMIIYTNYRTDTLALRLGSWGEDKLGGRVATNGGYGPVTTMCPEGFYAVGLTAWGNRGGQYTGCFNEAQLLCRKLHVK